MNIYTIKSENLVVKVTDLGAELTSIQTPDGTEYLWQGNPEYWSGKAPNLFPYVARLVDGKYIWKGAENDMPKHGFARKSLFSVAQATENSIIFELVDNETTRLEYPAHFVFRLSYSLAKSTLSITYEVVNKDSEELIFGLGAHPGFNVPIDDGKAFEDYFLHFASPECLQRVKFSERCFVLGRENFELSAGDVLPLTHGMFDDDAIVLEGAGHEVTLECGDGGKSVTASYPNMRYIGFWHAVKTDAPYVCIEPWCSLPATEGKITNFEEQEDLIHLTSGGTYKNTWQIKIH